MQTVWKRYAHQNGLNYHMKKHNDEAPNYVCEHCDKRFSFLITLKSHISRIHERTNPSFVCLQCGKQYIHLVDLRTHIKMHTGEQQMYTCDKCSKQFVKKYKLEEHLRGHTGEKPYTCGVCCKKFSVRESLRRHLRIHTGEKPYHCNVCDKAFAYKETLQNHVRIHTGEKPAACGEWDERFAGNQDEPMFIDERSTHETPSIPHFESQEASHPCGECLLTFTQDCLLTEHVRIHHSTVEKQSSTMTDRPRGDVNRLLYGCGICCQYFATKEEVVKCFNEHELQTGRQQ